MINIRGDWMVKHTFLNLASTDVLKSRGFFTHIGFEINEQFSDESGFCVVVNDNTFLMVMNPTKFQGFTLTDLPNSFKETEIIMTFQLETKEEVDAFMEKVIEAKGTEFGEANDNDFMYFRSFRDLDGHHFEVFYFKQ
jgi:predicted lactoylglutathione lyase